MSTPAVAESTASATSSAATSAAPQMRTTLTSAVMQTLGPARIFDVPAPVRSLTFSDTGERLLAATEDGGVHMYDCHEGERLGSSSLAALGGVELVRFTHGKNKILFSSPAESRVGYWDLASSELVHSFEGHMGRVTALEMSPYKDVFASGDEGSVKIWDLVNKRCIGNLTVKGTPVIAWDPSGLAIGVACSETKSVALYDPSNLGKPFLTLRLHEKVTRVTSMAFSNNGEHILVGAEGGMQYIYDGFDTESRLLFVLRAHATPRPGVAGPAQDLCWTPDGHFVLLGTQDGTGQVCVWEVPEPRKALAPAAQELDSTARLQGPASDPRVVAFHPRRALLVTAGDQICFWLPAPEAVGATDGADTAGSTL